MKKLWMVILAACFLCAGNLHAQGGIPKNEVMYATTPTALTDTAGAIPWATGSGLPANPNATVTLNTSANTLTPTGMIAGGKYTAYITQPSSAGPDTLTGGTGGSGGCSHWDIAGVVEDGGIPLSLANNAVDAVVWTYLGGKCVGAVVPGLGVASSMGSAVSEICNGDTFTNGANARPVFCTDATAAGITLNAPSTYVLNYSFWITAHGAGAVTITASGNINSAGTLTIPSKDSAYVFVSGSTWIAMTFVGF